MVSNADSDTIDIIVDKYAIKTLGPYNCVNMSKITNFIIFVIVIVTVTMNQAQDLKLGR